MGENIEMAKKIGRDITRGIKNMGIISGRFGRHAYTAPSAIRITNNSDSESKADILRNTVEGYLAGEVAQFVPYLGVCLTKAFLEKNYNGNVSDLFSVPGYFWTIPLITNTLSGIYEWFRYEKNIIKNPKSSNLEKEVEEPEPIETKPVETNFINPWEVKIPKYEKKNKE